MKNRFPSGKNLAANLMDCKVPADQPPICTIDREGFRNSDSPM
jgi:hypothetical protein